MPNTTVTDASLQMGFKMHHLNRNTKTDEVLEQERKIVSNYQNNGYLT
jgi:hypothetical protein